MHGHAASGLMPVPARWADGTCTARVPLDLQRDSTAILNALELPEESGP